MNREIKDVRWANDSKTMIFCKFHYEDGKVVEAFVSDTQEGNPDWKEIMDSFGEEKLNENTNEYLAEINRKKDLDSQRKKELEENIKNEMLFNAKLDSFAIEEIKNSNNTFLKSKIRKAQNIMEVQAFTTILLTKELEITNTNDEPKKKRGRKKKTTESPEITNTNE